ncbi:O-antigen ligase family protein [Mesorhizobium sp. 1B3]|uniref:O-antigen ligase family protein n=1 Tax=Mesorhizobium sp. 1B3 TaxID=3243599 RepID=UPI003D99EE22
MTTGLDPALQSEQSKPVTVVRSASAARSLTRATRSNRRTKIGPDQTGQVEAGTRPQRAPWPVLIFIASLVIPWIIPLGPLSMSPYRFVLLALLVPCLVMWAGGRAGPILAVDVAVLLYCVWSAISVAVAHGASASVQPTGIFFIETMGAYLLARCYIRTAADFESMVVLVTRTIILLLPFAAYEWVAGQKPLLSIFGAVFPTVDVTLMEPRLGFWRVQGPFAHAILFGLFCGSMFVLAFYVPAAGYKTIRRRLSTGMVAAAAVMSMSSAPIAGLLFQLALIGWNWLLRQNKNRWKILWALAFAGYLVVELGSNQSPIQFYISYFTFDKNTGWFRLYIWEYGSASVRNNPLFGIGFNDWVRPKWMVPDSVDNFWLLTAMRYGVPALAFILGAYLWLLFQIASRKFQDEKLQTYKVAYLICMTTYFIVGTTVHLWAAPYVCFLFLLGSGAWFLHASAECPEAPVDVTKSSLSRGNFNPKYSRRAPARAREKQ